MYVEKRGDKYRFVERYNIAGQVRRVSVTLDRDTPQARKKAAQMLAEKMAVPTSGLTYAQLVKMYIDYQKATLKMSTWTRNQASLKRLEKIFGKARVDKMTSGYIDMRLLEFAPKPGTYNEYLKRIKAMFRWAYKKDFIPSSACVDKIEPRKDEGRKKKLQEKYLEIDELKAVLDAASPYYRNIFEFLILSGLRIGELMALNDSDVSTEINVDKTYDIRNGIITTTKTEAGTRSVHVQPELAACIRRIRVTSKQNMLISGRRSPLFVVSVYGGRLSYEKTNRTFSELCERMTGKHLTLHALRHTHVALMAYKGIDFRAISARLGHSDPRITQDIYYHVIKEQKAKDAAAFDAVSIFA